MKRIMKTPERPQHDPDDLVADASVEHPMIDSRQLFRGSRELQIRHEGELYRLRVTRNGKLILNK